jgi:hypothetical protein
MITPMIDETDLLEFQWIQDIQAMTPQGRSRSTRVERVHQNCDMTFVISTVPTAAAALK